MSDPAGLIRIDRGFESSGDGYDYIVQLEDEKTWWAVSIWGEEGWDLGDWPYVVYFLGTIDGHPVVRERCEGDLTTWVFGAEAEAHAFLDTVAERHWRRNPDRYGLTVVFEQHPEGSELPARYKGPFTWARCDAAQAAKS